MITYDELIRGYAMTKLNRKSKHVVNLRVRLTIGLHKALKESAAKNRRSLNSEMLARLLNSYKSKVIT